MSIRARILNYALKKYVKKVQPPVEDRSYLEARKMMNQKGYDCLLYTSDAADEP